MDPNVLESQHHKLTARRLKHGHNWLFQHDMISNTQSRPTLSCQNGLPKTLNSIDNLWIKSHVRTNGNSYQSCLVEVQLAKGHLIKY